MVDAYLAGASAENAARSVGMCKKSCLNALKAAGVKTRTTSEACRIYALNEDFFHEITTEVQAYILGFIAADGCIPQEKNRCRIVLARCDCGHLEKIKVAVGSERPVTDTQTVLNGIVYPQSTVDLCSKKLTADLVRLGIVPNKTYIGQPWQGPAHLMPAYWRGHIDGNGCFYLPSNRPHSAHLTLTGNRFMVEGFCQFCEPLVGYRGRISPGNGRGYSTIYSRLVAVQTIIRALYSDATIWLDRKKVIADHILTIKPRGE